jgi:hypothetical protein
MQACLFCNITLCCGQHVARELRVEGAWIRGKRFIVLSSCPDGPGAHFARLSGGHRSVITGGCDVRAQPFAYIR